MSADIREFARVVRKIPSWRESVSDETTLMVWIRLFLRCRIKSFRTLSTVSIVFDSDLKAEEFLKLVRRANGGGQNARPE